MNGVEEPVELLVDRTNSGSPNSSNIRHSRKAETIGAGFSGINSATAAAKVCEPCLDSSSVCSAPAESDSSSIFTKTLGTLRLGVLIHMFSTSESASR